MNTFRRLGGELLSFGFLIVCSMEVIEGQPVVYQATGTRQQIQPVIDQFKHDVIFGPGGSEQNPPAQLGRYYVATFDDVSSSSTTTRTPISLTSGGVNILANVFGGTLLVSATLDDLANPNRLFGDINASYPTEFQAFSGPSILGLQYWPAGSQSMGNNGLYLSIGNPFDYAPKNAFGGVFSGVETAQTAFFEAYNYDFDPLDPERVQIYDYPIPPSNGPGTFSFLGVIMTAGRIGGLNLYMPDLTAATQDAAAVDDLTLGAAPPALPEPNSMILLLVGGCLGWIARRYRQKSD